MPILTAEPLYHCIEEDPPFEAEADNVTGSQLQDVTAVAKLFVIVGKTVPVTVGEAVFELAVVADKQ